ncbi:MMPL family transporter [Kutzneria buriramensis]|uniref:RND superfamily putative drug exporter n=1 Tax=Kutzneria buriramensis TaxID=1045776 RepID=A0A3E0HKM9_9PSEU|nr:MMPL family transporter [Kutzneria buriramensis]REH47043.1 RND superfamily putative drug exporter [Kutzneria buriramensis]
MFATLGRFVTRHHRAVLIVALALLVLGGLWGSGAPGSLSGGGGFDDPNSASVHADQLLAGPLGRDVSDVVAVYSSPTKTVDDPGFAQPVQRALAAIPRGDVTRLDSYWSTHSADYVSSDRHSAYATLQLRSSDDQERVKELKAIQSYFNAPGVTVRLGGMTPMTSQVNAQSASDIVRAEALSLPVLLLLLVIIFGSLVAASFPLAIGILVVIGSLGLLRFVTIFTDLSTFAIEMVSVLGLGLAIDYALLMVNRFREELRGGRTVDAAIERTVATAGRTVAFSALAVATSLLGMLLFPSRFLQSMGYAGVATVLLAAASSLTVLPALLKWAGPWVDALRIPLPRWRTPADETQGRWYRVAKTVMRRPVLSAVGIVLVLVTLGLPLLGANWARPGDWVLPVNADARAVTQQLATQFKADPAKVITGVVELPGSVGAASSAVRDYAQRLAAVPGVHGASVTGTYDNLARISVGYAMDPQSREARTLVEDLRAQSPPTGATVSFTGMPASRVDIVDMVTARLPWMILFVAVVAFLALFLAFGSVVLPLKSLLLNLLSLSASFGAIKLIFQDGWLSGVLNFVPVGAIDINFPVLIVAIAFGLSMDYEVFLVSRIREQWARGGDGEEAIALGGQRTARIITSAALLLAIVVGGFLTSGITFMKMIGVGLVITVLVDATIVRGLLVPATMKLLGRWAWWAPAPLARWWSRHGFVEGDDDRPAPVPDSQSARV